VVGITQILRRHGVELAVHIRIAGDFGLGFRQICLSRHDLVVSGPLYRDMAVEGSKVRLHFDSVGTGLLIGAKSGPEPLQPTPGRPLTNFAVAGADQHWVRATALIDGKDVLVSSPEVPQPVAVRYAYCQDPVGCNLYNQEGLPASPFRTDAW